MTSMQRMPHWNFSAHSSQKQRSSDGDSAPLWRNWDSGKRSAELDWPPARGVDPPSTSWPQPQLRPIQATATTLLPHPAPVAAHAQ